MTSLPPPSSTSITPNTPSPNTTPRPTSEQIQYNAIKLAIKDLEVTAQLMADRINLLNTQIPRTDQFKFDSTEIRCLEKIFGLRETINTLYQTLHSKTTPTHDDQKVA